MGFESIIELENLKENWELRNGVRIDTEGETRLKIYTRN